MCAICGILAQRNDELAEEVRQLREQLQGGASGLAWEPPAEFCLSRGQRLAVLRALIARDRVAPYWHLIELVTPWSHDRTEVSLKQLNVLVSQVRRVLRPYGLIIENVWNEGYRLTPDSRARLLNWTSETAVAA